VRSSGHSGDDQILALAEDIAMADAVLALPPADVAAPAPEGAGELEPHPARTTAAASEAATVTV